MIIEPQGKKNLLKGKKNERILLLPVKIDKFCQFEGGPQKKTRKRKITRAKCTAQLCTCTCKEMINEELSGKNKIKNAEERDAIRI